LKLIQPQCVISCRFVFPELIGKFPNVKMGGGIWRKEVKNRRKCLRSNFFSQNLLQRFRSSPFGFTLVEEVTGKQVLAIFCHIGYNSACIT
jgi:hypothetical protein